MPAHTQMHYLDSMLQSRYWSIIYNIIPSSGDLGAFEPAISVRTHPGQHWKLCEQS